MAKFRERILIYVDGASIGNPGPSGIGIIIYDEEGNETRREAKYIGEATNNEAEYRAVLEALNIAPALCTHHIEIYSDSELIIKQLNRQFRPKAKHLFKIHKEIRACENIFKSVEYVLVPRTNKRIEKADRLAAEVIEKTLKGGE